MTPIRKLAVLTSGGDAPGMNAAIRSVVRTSVYHNIPVYGIYRGYQGLLENDFVELDRRSVNHILQRGGTVLKSARCPSFHEKAKRKRAIEMLREKHVDALVCIGGDGTFRGAEKIQAEGGPHVIGIPGTIDNDIPLTDSTIGFSTACNTVLEAVDKIRDTAQSHGRIFVIEVMGRDSGHIAIESALAAGALMVYIPERKSEIEPLVDKLIMGKTKRKTSSIVIVAEGDELGGAPGIAEKLRELLPEYETKVTVLGHVQRGGSPSVFDRNLASRMGHSAVEYLLTGKSSGMVGIQKDEMCFVPFNQLHRAKKTIDAKSLEIIDVLSI